MPDDYRKSGLGIGQGHWKWYTGEFSAHDFLIEINCFRSAAPTIWNSLPSHVRSCETLTIYRRHLKFHFFHSALPTA